MEPVDLTNCCITDNSWNLTRRKIPDGTIIQPNDDLILWADEDSTDGIFHTDFKLASGGEIVTLMNESGEIADQSIYETQVTQMGFAGSPDGFGEFTIQ